MTVKNTYQRTQMLRIQIRNKPHSIRRQTIFRFELAKHCKKRWNMILDTSHVLVWIIYAFSLYAEEWTRKIASCGVQKILMKYIGSGDTRE